MSKQDQILDIVRLKGPVLPVHVAREAQLSMLFAGAYLAELSSSKKIVISKLKVGASPLYYIQGQEAKLQNYSKHLGNKEQEALNVLRDEKILNDKDLEPAIRVALRSIPDFAVPVKVNLKSGSELYWKWYLIPNNEAEIMIRELINKKLEQEKAIELEKEQEKIEQEKLEVQKEEQEIEVEPEEKEIQEEKKVTKPKIKKKVVKKKAIKKKTVQKELIETPKVTNDVDIEDALLDKVKEHFNDKGILIQECYVANESKEIDMKIIIPSIIGDLPYFCKVKKKVRCTEKDLLETLLTAQKKGLPGLFVATGTINKKGKDLLAEQEHNIQFLSLK